MVAAAAEQKPVTEWIEIIAPEESGGAPSPTAQRPGQSHRKRISQPRLPKDCALRVRVRLRHSRVARLEELVTSLAVQVHTAEEAEARGDLKWTDQGKLPHAQARWRAPPLPPSPLQAEIQPTAAAPNTRGKPSLRQAAPRPAAAREAPRLSRTMPESAPHEQEQRQHQQLQQQQKRGQEHGERSQLLQQKQRMAQRQQQLQQRQQQQQQQQQLQEQQQQQQQQQRRRRQQQQQQRQREQQQQRSSRDPSSPAVNLSIFGGTKHSRSRRK